MNFPFSRVWNLITWVKRSCHALLLIKQLSAQWVSSFSCWQALNVWKRLWKLRVPNGRFSQISRSAPSFQMAGCCSVSYSGSQMFCEGFLWALLPCSQLLVSCNKHKEVLTGLWWQSADRQERLWCVTFELALEG